MAMTSTASSTRAKREWRRYPALLSPVLAALLAVFVLPSALKLPQTNPTQTAEYAPVPPSDKQQTPQIGNLSSLGLGSSGTLGAGDGGAGVGGEQAAGPPPPPEVKPPGVGTTPRQKRCVGNPPRQTEDAMAPPCVGYYSGDNGGATYQGVTATEVNLVLYVDWLLASATDNGSDNEQDYMGQCYDMVAPPDPNEHSVTMRNARRWQRYFNDRYQTYNRFVHFFVCFGSTDANGNLTPETRQADAAAHYAAYHPFAIVTTGLAGGGDEPYLRYMAAKKVLSFGSVSLRSEEFYNASPGLVWGYDPAIELRAQTYSNYVCQKVLNNPVVDSGDGHNGQPRKLGFISTTDDRYSALVTMADLIRKAITKCGAVIAKTATFPAHARDTQSLGSDPAAAYAQTNMADFSSAGITTIIWAGGYETDQGKAAANLGYYPEIIWAGDGYAEGNYNVETFANQNFMSHAWMITPVTKFGERPTWLCRKAIAEADPNSSLDTNWACLTTWYEDLRELFLGIQVAGPKLRPESVDQGFHAIPAVDSTNPEVPSCYYKAGDYTCVKDAVVEHYDPTTNPPGSNYRGCWRMLEDGKRYREGQWPAGNINAQWRPDNVCNNYDHNALLF
jgi:hypothetical protein